MLSGSARTKLMIRLFIGMATAALGGAFHLLAVFTVGLIVLAVAVIRFGNDRRGGGDW
jgi:hypothetical protein